MADTQTEDITTKYEMTDHKEQAVFIPIEPGVFAPIIIECMCKRSQENAILDSDSKTKSIETSGQKIFKTTDEVNVVLDIKNQPKRLRNILENFEMIVVGQIEDHNLE